MPANLPPQYYEAEKGYRMARIPEEKVRALEFMLSIMPKHKGTDKLRADLRRKIAKFSQETKKQARKKGHSYRIRKEGAGQVALVGLPNVGKSQLLRALTEASPEVGDYPFTTHTPTPGMMRFENIQIQLIDTPSLTDRNSQAWLPAILRGADALLAVIDLSIEPRGQVETILEVLCDLKIKPPGTGESSAPEWGVVQKKLLLVGNKGDLSPSQRNYRELKLKYGDQFPAILVSALQGDGLAELAGEVYHLLDIIRVYTRARGGKADLSEPVILKACSTVEDFATAIHKDFGHNLKYAQVWGSGKYQGQNVGRDYSLWDGDVVELHM